MASPAVRLSKAVGIFLHPRSPAAVYRNPIPLINLTRARALNFMLRRSRSNDGPGVTCNTCGWQGRRFGYSAAVSANTFHKDAVCLRCGANPRTRALAEVVRQTLPLDTPIEVLDIGAAPATRRVFEGTQARYRVLDPFKEGEVAGSMEHIAADDAAFDAILCCHVIEHVPDYRAALHEVRRVLKPGARAILMVPQKAGLEKSYPLSGPSYLGYGHLWEFGEDFPDLVAECGFRIVERDRRSSEAPAERFQIVEPAPAA